MNVVFLGKLYVSSLALDNYVIEEFWGFWVFFYILIGYVIEYANLFVCSLGTGD